MKPIIILALLIISANVQAQIVPPIVGFTHLCPGDHATLTDDSVGGTWSSNNCFAASINPVSGIVTALGAGTAVITYTISSGFATMTLSVSPSASMYAYAVDSDNDYGDNQFAQVVVDKHNNVYACNLFLTSVDKIAADGSISVFAGSPTDLSLPVDGNNIPATAVTVEQPQGISIDRYGNIYIADEGASTVKKVDTNGIMTIYAGILPSLDSPGVWSSGYSGDGGSATNAELQNPSNLAFDRNGNLFILDGGSYIRKVDSSGIITTFAGNGALSLIDGMPATNANLPVLSGLAVDKYNNLLITERHGGKILQVTPGGILSTVAVLGAPGETMEGIATDTLGNLFVIYNGALVYIEPSGVISSYGNSSSSVTPDPYSSSIDGYPVTSTFMAPIYGIALDQFGNIFLAGEAYVAEISSNLKMPKPSGMVNLCIGDTSTYTNALYPGVWTTSNPAVATIDPSTGVLTALASGSDTVFYAMNSGCDSATSFLVITVNPSPTGIIAPMAVCLGTGLTVSDSLPGGIWSSSGNASVDSLGFFTPIYSGPDTLYYSIAGNCRAIAYLAIDTLPGTIAGPDSICFGTVVTYTDAVPSGTWATVTGNLTIDAGGEAAGSIVGNDTVIYTLVNACGTNVATLPMTVITTLAAGSVIGADSVCIGASVTYSDSVIGGTWTATGVSIAGGVIVPMLVGIDTISYATTNSCGSVNAWKSIFVGSVSGSGTISGPTNICSGTVATYTDTVIGGVWMSTYGGITGGIFDPTVSCVDTISYQITNFCGVSTSEFIVSVNPIPEAGVIIGADSLCVAANTTVFSSSGGGLWSASNGNATISGLGFVTGVAAGRDTLTYTVTNLCGSASASAVLTVDPLPFAGTIVGPDTICVGSPVTLSTSGSGGDWLLSAPSVATIVSGVLTGVADGADSVYYTVVNSCGSSVSTLAVDILSVPTMAAISGSDSVCTGASVTLTSSLSGGIWSMANSRATISSGIVTGLFAGPDSAIYTLSNSCGSTPALFSVDIISVGPAAIITGDTVVCEGTTVTLHTSISGGDWTWPTTSGISVSPTGIVTTSLPGTDTLNYETFSYCGGVVGDFVLNVEAHITPVVSGTWFLCPDRPDTIFATPSGGTLTFSNSDVSSTGAGSFYYLSEVAPGWDTLFYSYSNICGLARDTVRLNSLTTWQCDSLLEARSIIETSKNMSIVPNPGTGTFYVYFPFSGNVSLVVTNILGQTILHKDLSDNAVNELNISLEHQPAGTYFVVMIADNNRYSGRIILLAH